jgi:hypothetical protein
MTDEERTARERAARADHPSEDPKWLVLKHPLFIMQPAKPPTWPSHDDIIAALMFANRCVSLRSRIFTGGYSNSQPAPRTEPSANPFMLDSIIDWKITGDDYLLQRIAVHRAEYGEGPYRVMSVTNSRYDCEIGTIPPQVTMMPLRGVALTIGPFAHSWFRLIEDES